jgi:hypothetical protein
MNNYISDLFTKILVFYISLKYKITEYINIIQSFFVDLYNKTKVYVNDHKNTQLVLLIVMLLIGTVGLSLCMAIVPGLSAYPAIIGNVGFALLLWKLVDKYFLPDFDLIPEIKKGNIAAALYFLCYCALIVASIVTT